MSIYARTFWDTLTSGYRMRRSIGASRARALYVSLLDAVMFTRLLFWLRRLSGPGAEEV